MSMQTFVGAMLVHKPSSVQRSSLASRHFDVPKPAIKPALVTVRTDTALNRHLIHAAGRVYEQQQGQRMWQASATTDKGGVDALRFKQADLQLALGDPQVAAQTLFGPQLRLVGDQTHHASAPTHAQLSQTMVRDGESLKRAVQREQVRALAVLSQPDEAASEVLGALLEATVDKRVAQAVRAIGHGQVPVVLAGKNGLWQALDSGVGPIRRQAPAVFVDGSDFWSALAASPAVAAADLTKLHARVGVAVYMDAKSPFGSALDILLSGGLDPNEAATRVASQRDHVGALAVARQLLLGENADFAAAGQLAETIYPEGLEHRLGRHTQRKAWRPF